MMMSKSAMGQNWSDVTDWKDVVDIRVRLSFIDVEMTVFIEEWYYNRSIVLLKTLF